MSEKEKSKGLRAKTKSVEVHPLPTRLENKFLSKSDFLARREKEKRANKIADEAREKALAEAGVSKNEAEEDEADELTTNKISEIKEKIKATKEGLDKDPENKGLKIKLGKLQVKLDEEESKL